METWNTILIYIYVHIYAENWEHRSGSDRFNYYRPRYAQMRRKFFDEILSYISYIWNMYIQYM